MIDSVGCFRSMMSQTKKLSIAFYWHMHQPVYQLTPQGDYIMPWVRLHAVKDYLDMMLWVEKFKKLKLNFNYVPILLDSLIEYSNGAHDIHSRLTVTDAENLSHDDKIFILNNFFDSNYQTMILPNEQYHRLYKIIQENGTDDTDIFTLQEYSDLMALFNLAWIDPSFRNSDERLVALVNKSKNYTLEDRIQIIDIQREIIKKIIPTLKKLAAKNKIEVTTSPYYHPILPILLDYKEIRNDASDELSELNTEEDARLQTKLALDRIEELIGKRPKGIWASEQCISPSTLRMLSDLGIEWSISDEGNLARSIDFEFVHDFKGYLEDPYHLLKTYAYKTDKSDIKMIFRESSMYNLISFEYADHNPVATANDLYDRIKILQSKILSSPDENHLLTIAMDGENCWENYIEDGNKFLETLYELICNDSSIETVLISDYIENCKNHKELNKIATGASFNRGYKLWINEPVKDAAWKYLKTAKEDLTAFSRREPNHPNLSYAQKELFICEGSDWFWWYGEPNSSGRDNIFDFIFRTHLKNIYKTLGLDYPKYLDEPLAAPSPARPSNFPRALISPAVNGKNIQDDDTWLNAGCIDIPDGPVLRESKLFDKICFGNDNDNFYLRFYLNKYIKNNQSPLQRTYQMYIYLRGSGQKHALSPIRLINKTTNISPISMEKFHNEIQISIRDDELRFLRLVKAIPGDMWLLENYKNMEAVYDEVLDLKIPFDVLGIDFGEKLEFIFINANYGMTDFYIPNEMVLSIQRPKNTAGVNK